MKILPSQIHPLILFDPASQKAIALDLSVNNRDLLGIDVMDTGAFSDYITGKLQASQADFGYGGYGEFRGFYTRSELFSGSQGIQGEEPRRFHLGIDIWGKEGTPVFAPMDGLVHSFAYNNRFGDYGATILLSHQWGQESFHTLYGHLSLKDLESLQVGTVISGGQLLAHFGGTEENGHWPPHLHVQMVRDLQGFKGDYPGVCKFSERFHYLENCPDPGFLAPF